MKRYIYCVSVNKQTIECDTVTDAVAFANACIGCDLLTRDMVYNYFSKSRPNKVNKNIVGKLIQLSRVDKVKRPSSVLTK